MVGPPRLDPDPHMRPHLVNPVFDWCVGGAIARSPAEDRFQGLTARGSRMCVAIGVVANSLADLSKQVSEDHDLLIDMADWLVSDAVKPDSSLYKGRGEGKRLATLDEMLMIGGSAWAVDRDLPGLSLRVSDEERQVYETATATEDTATAYLREAWAAAWGVSPNGDLACAKAVDALEAAFRREVCPNNDGASLGEIARDLRAKPKTWSARFDDARPRSDDRRRPNAGVSLLSKSLGVIFAANHRHGATDEHSTNSLDDGRDAVTLATALIAMQRRGFLERTAEKR